MGILEKFAPQKLAFGGASISGEGAGYGFGAISKEKSYDLLRFAFDNEVRIFDSAPIYGFGESESRIGKAINRNREKAFYISKSGVTWDKSKRVDMTNSVTVAKKMFNQSLKNFDCDYIDLYMVHWPDVKIDIRFVLEYYQTLKMKGKILHIGLCNTNQNDLKKAQEVCQIEVVQSEHNLFNDKNDFINFDNNIEFMGWGTFDKGILSNRVTKKREQAKQYDEYDCRKSAPWWNQKDVLEKILRVEEFKNKYLLEFSMAEFAFLFCFQSNFLPLIGSKNIKDLEQILNWAKENRDISNQVREWYGKV